MLVHWISSFKSQVVKPRESNGTIFRLKRKMRPGSITRPSPAIAGPVRFHPKFVAHTTVCSTGLWTSGLRPWSLTDAEHDPDGYGSSQPLVAAPTTDTIGKSPMGDTMGRPPAVRGFVGWSTIRISAHVGIPRAPPRRAAQRVAPASKQWWPRPVEKNMGTRVAHHIHQMITLGEIAIRNRRRIEAGAANSRRISPTPSMRQGEAPPQDE